jgi:hypothetical protein
MKRCPKCNLSYSDETLEFCLEDGVKLVFATSRQAEQPTVTKSNLPSAATDQTLNLPFSNVSNPLDVKSPHQQPANNFQAGAEAKTIASTELKEKVTSQGYKILEIAPIVLSLAHNWWQWLYLNNQYYYSFSTYVLSANFLMWLLLLAAGAVTSLLAIKLCRSKAFAYTSLVILAINLLLFLVPKR